jgi:hypothetical protein
MRVESIYKDYNEIQHMTTRDNAVWRKLIVMNAILHLGGKTQNAKEYVLVMPSDGEFKNNALGCKESYDDCIPNNTAFLTHRDDTLCSIGALGVKVIMLSAGNAVRITTTDQYDPW